jgi:hypothetical protein
MRNIFLWFIILCLFGCEQRSSDFIAVVEDSIDTRVTTVEPSPINKTKHIYIDSIVRDTMLDKYIEDIGIGNLYFASTIHDTYQIEGYFNSDQILDTAIIVKHKKNNKDGLLIKHGGRNDFIILGAGEDVLSQGFDDFDWVGVFNKIDKGEKISSNMDDESGEILTHDIPDAEKHTLLTDGIYVHASESCGGGIIYWDKETYNWMQQE